MSVLAQIWRFHWSREMGNKQLARSRGLFSDNLIFFFVR